MKGVGRATPGRAGRREPRPGLPRASRTLGAPRATGDGAGDPPTYRDGGHDHPSDEVERIAIAEIGGEDPGLREQGPVKGFPTGDAGRGRREARTGPQYLAVKAAPQPYILTMYVKLTDDGAMISRRPTTRSVSTPSATARAQASTSPGDAPYSSGTTPAGAAQARSARRGRLTARQ